ncbi:MliC family protein [Pseudorhodoplanes sp.]|jgi:membrane-bound inhibitor of C-type lysozyme|uniref:MliC family protein n=1 Tax=Pseudorhodoplanes sp. TaxID=1934341 RepID=UPI002D7E16F4|nr:MliC family protein [Pseudorhodoplanes sp.]
MKRVGLILLLSFCAASVANAQAAFTSYLCDDGTQVVSALYRGDKRIRLQFDGHAHTLPQRLAPFGARYSKNGVSFWVRGQDARLKRPKVKTTVCKPQ